MDKKLGGMQHEQFIDKILWDEDKEYRKKQKAQLADPKYKAWAKNTLLAEIDSVVYITAEDR